MLNSSPTGLYVSIMDYLKTN